ncbi:DDB1- and CUL4-associated factor 8 isoform X1 [Euwallacea similis]|uniref:DDB1- and CUL4-associated factor 8 isoform X1 n=1 Tax=Euwallacea similis TaxID=1736056 RepID=UPI00344C9D3B
MDESTSQARRAEDPMDLDQPDSAKRMKTDFDLSEESSSSSLNSENNPVASTSSDSGIPVTNTDSSNIATTDEVPNGTRHLMETGVWIDEELNLLESLLNNTSETNTAHLPTTSTSSDGGLASRSTDSGAADNLPSASESANNRSDLNDEAFSLTFNLRSTDADNNRLNLNELSCDSDVFSSRHSNSENTMLRSTDTESDEDKDTDDILKKEKPKYSWFMVPQIVNRQYGYPASSSNPVLFQQKCYGSLTNVEKLELMYKLEEHEGCVNSLNFSPDGKWLATGSDDLKVVIWDWAIGKVHLKINTKHKRNIFQTKFLYLNGPDLHLATCGKDGQVWYLQIGNEGIRENQKLGQHRGPCHKLSTLKDQPPIVLSAGEDGIVFNHDIRKFKPERIVHVKDDNSCEVALYSIHSHPLKSEQFCVAGREHCVRVYDQRKTSSPLNMYCPYGTSDPKYSRGYHITCAIYNHDGSEILASYNDDDIYLFDPDMGMGNYSHRYSGHRNGATIKGVNFFGSRSEFIMSGSDCAHVFFWEKRTEAITQLLLADDNGVVNCLEPHPELPFLATSGLDWDVKLWVPSCEEELSLVDLAETVKENKASNIWGNYDSASESQVLWMLWRRLRESRAARARERGNESDLAFLTIDSSDTSSDELSSHSNESNDESHDGCNTS